MTSIPPTEQRLPPETVYGRLDPGGPGITRAEEFEEWDQEDDNPVELIDGWVLPMSPGNLKAGKALGDLNLVLGPIVKARNWFMTLDARHRLPQPPNTVVFPDIAIHAVAEPAYIPGTESTGRVPEIALEILGRKSWERDTAPRGAKFLAYRMSGVREYYYTWPDGRDASGFVLHEGAFVPLPRDPEGFFRSPFLGCSLRLVEAAAREQSRPD